MICRCQYLWHNNNMYVFSFITDDYCDCLRIYSTKYLCVCVRACVRVCVCVTVCHCVCAVSLYVLYMCVCMYNVCVCMCMCTCTCLCTCAHACMCMYLCCTHTQVFISTIYKINEQEIFYMCICTYIMIHCMVIYYTKQ